MADDTKKDRTPAYLKGDVVPVKNGAPKYLDANHGRVKRSKRHETRLAKELGGKRLPASGAKPYGARDLNTSGADIKTERFMVQHKGTERDSIGVKREWLHELTVEAKRRYKQPMLIVTFEKETRFPSEWVAIPKDVFLRMMASLGADVDEQG